MWCEIRWNISNDIIIFSRSANRLIDWSVQLYSETLLCHKEGRACLHTWIICFMAAEFMAASLCFLLCPRSFGRTNIKQTHTETSNRPWAKAPVQTDQMHKLAFRDMHASMDKHERAHLDSHKQYLALSEGHTVCCAMCVLCLCPISVRIPWDARRGQVNSLYATLPHVTFTFLLNQVTLHWLTRSANIQPFLKTCAVPATHTTHI